MFGREIERREDVPIVLYFRTFGNSKAQTAEILDDVIRYWDGYLSNAFALKPDLIVLPEACDRPNSFPMKRRLPKTIL